MKDERDFLMRLCAEFKDCPMWPDIMSVATPEKRHDLQPNQVMVFIRPPNADLPVVHAFRITVESMLFPPDEKPLNGHHFDPSATNEPKLF